MDGELQLSSERAIGFTWLRARGQLSVGTATRLRGLLVKALGDAGRVVADLDGLTAPKTMLTTFAAAQVACGGWPQARLALLVPDETARREMTTSGLSRVVPIRKNMADAVAALDERPQVVRRRLELDGDPTSTALARALVNWAYKDWGVIPRVGLGAVLMASDLVADAQRRGAMAMRLSVELSYNQFRVSLRDWSVVEPDADELHKILLATFDAASGVTVHTDGRTVWASMTVPPP